MTRPVLPEGELPEALRLAVRSSAAAAKAAKPAGHAARKVSAAVPDLLRVATTAPVATEWEEQVRLVAWAAWAAGDPIRAALTSSRAHLLDQFAQAYGEAEAGAWPDLAGLVAVPNGTRATQAAAARAKAEGVRAGYPDLVLDVARIVGGRPYLGYRLELKRSTGGKVAAAQVAWADRLLVAGYYVTVVRGMEAARADLLAYLAGRPLLPLLSLLPNLPPRP